MDEVEHYKLQLKTFETEVIATWKSIQTQEKFHDVTVACDNNEIKAHKVILSANSSVFRTILGQNHHPHPVIYLRGIKFKYLCHILDFIYQGQVYIEQKTINEFLSVAEDLEIKGLTENERRVVTSIRRSEPPLIQNFQSVENIKNKIPKDQNKDVENSPTNYQEFQPSQDNNEKKNSEAVTTLSNHVEQEDTKLVVPCDLDFKQKRNIDPRKRKSLVWKYFNVVQTSNNTFVQCNICQKRLKYCSGRTSNMIYHIEQHCTKESVDKLDSEYIVDPNKIESNSAQRTIEDLSIIGSTNLLKVQESQKNVEQKDTKLVLPYDLDFKPKVSKDPKRTSFVWNYFDFAQTPEQTYVECNICAKKFKYCGGTTNMIGHIKQHIIEGSIDKPDIEMQVYNHKLENNTSVVKQHNVDEDVNKFDTILDTNDTDNSFINSIYHTCDRCDYITLDKSTMETHKQSFHIGIGFSCDKCDFEATQEDSLKQHINSIHENINNTNLKIKQFSPLRQEGYPCDVCYHVANTKYDLKCHIGDAHKDFKKYHCDVCLYATNQKSHLDEHKNAVHKKIRYPCDVCNFQSQTVRMLKGHMIKMHTNNAMV